MKNMGNWNNWSINENKQIKVYNWMDPIDENSTNVDIIIDKEVNYIPESVNNIIDDCIDNGYRLHRYVNIWNYDSALMIVNEMLIIDPFEYDLLLMKWKILFKLNKIEEWLVIYELCLDYEYANKILYIKIANIYNKQQEYKKSLWICNRWLDLYKLDEWLLELKYQNEFKLLKFWDSINTINKALLKSKKSYTFHIYKTQSLSALNLNEEALLVINDCIRLYPMLWKNYYLRWFIQKKLNHKNYIGSYNSAISNWKLLKEEYFRMWNDFYDDTFEWHYQKSLESFNKCLDEYPDDYKTYEMIWLVYKKLGNTIESNNAYKIANKLKNNII